MAVAADQHLAADRGVGSLLRFSRSGHYATNRRPKRSPAPIGAYDVLIAGQAVARNLILVTHNAKEFGRVPGLRLEDWQA
jgi:predicted nucleic acid-binding protein